MLIVFHVNDVCFQQEPSSRPTMAEAVKTLESLEGAPRASEHVVPID